jgi:hypothetical protein
MAEPRVLPTSEASSPRSSGSDRDEVGEAPRLHRRRQPGAPATDLAALARERAVQSRRAQGLPDHISDLETLDQVAELVLADRPPTWAARSPP